MYPLLSRFTLRHKPMQKKLYIKGQSAYCTVWAYAQKTSTISEKPNALYPPPPRISRSHPKRHCPAGILKEKLHLEEKENFIATRKGILDPNTLTKEERVTLIKEKPAYGNIICRCEMITEGEIIDAIHRPLGAKSLDGVKRRTRAGMGRCQAGFCSPRTMEILARELDIPMSEITKSGGKSQIITGTNKDQL